MNSNQKIQIKINPKDLYKISPNLILNITLKNGIIVLLDDSIPSQEINELINNHNYDKNNNKYIMRNYNQSINFGINKSYGNNNINGRELEINDSFLFNNKEILNKSNNKNIYYSSNPNNSINKENNKEENKSPINEQMTNFKSQNQSNKSISDVVNEKFKKKFHTINNSEKIKRIKTSINSEININIKGNDAKKKYDNNLLKEFDELLLNFNGIKKGLNNPNIYSNNSKKKYRLYKKLNSKKNEKLLLDDLSGISANTKAIKYIGRNEQKNNITIASEINRNNLINQNNNNNRLSFLKEKTLKRNKSNNFYLLKNQRTITDIISPPNHLPYNKILLIKK